VDRADRFKKRLCLMISNSKSDRVSSMMRWALAWLVLGRSSSASSVDSCVDECEGAVGLSANNEEAWQVGFEVGRYIGCFSRCEHGAQSSSESGAVAEDAAGVGLDDSKDAGCSDYVGLVELQRACHEGFAKAAALVTALPAAAAVSVAPTEAPADTAAAVGAANATTMAAAPDVPAATEPAVEPDAAEVPHPLPRALGTAARVFGIPVTTASGYTKFCYARLEEPAETVAFTFCASEHDRHGCMDQVYEKLRSARKAKQFIDLSRARPLLQLPLQVDGLATEVVVYEGDEPKDVVQAFCETKGAALDRAVCLNGILPIVHRELGFSLSRTA